MVQLSLLLVVVGAAALSVPASVTVVTRPDTSRRNSHYPGNRAPLQPSAFVKLPVGAVKPRGWLLEMLKRQRAGLAGHLGEISAWLQKKGNAWLDPQGRGEWGWEELPYWLKGYVSMGYLLDDPAVQAESKVWIEGVLASQRPDGDFGPAVGDPPKRDFWGNMIMLYCLQTYYEATEDPRVLALMERYFRFQMQVPDEAFLNGYWQKVRGGDNLHSVLWLYNLTGEKWLLDLAEKIHRNTTDWTSPTHPFESIRNAKSKRAGTEWPDWFGDLPDWHNVNVAQAFREPAQHWQLTGDQADMEATYRNFRTIRHYFGQVPGGMFGGDENSRPGYDDPRQGIETCGIVEQMNSDEHLLRISGDPFWADQAEDVALNTYPASMMPDQRSLRYLTAPNMPLSDSESHHPGIDNGGPFLLMNPFSSRCCQHNHTQGWPYYAENLWMATPDDGLLAALYCASEVTAKVGTDGAEVTLVEETHYPFDEGVRIRIERGGGSFPLYLRIPRWCDGAALKVNGEPAGTSLSPSAYVRIEREWKRGDVVDLTLPMSLSVNTWAANHHSVSVDYGPLTFSLKIEVRLIERRSDETAIGDSKWQPGADPSKWASYEIHPASPWNYGLVLEGGPLSETLKIRRKPWPKSDFPFTLEDVPLRIEATGRRIPEWTFDATGLCAELQESPVLSKEPNERIELVPMGAARLRISAFPEISDAADARPWTPSPGAAQLYRASASHTFGGDSVRAVADGVEPSSSADAGIPRHTFWDHRGTREWIQAEFDEPRTIDRCAVYWFDDTGTGECRLPAEWSVEALEGGAWRPVRAKGPYPIERDRFCEVEFAPVRCTALRITVQLQRGFSAGVLEWRLGG